MGIFGPSKKRKLMSEPILPPVSGTKYLRMAVGSIPTATDAASASIRTSKVDANLVDLEVLEAAVKILGNGQLIQWSERLLEIGPDLRIVLDRADFSDEILTNFLLGRGTAQAVAAYNRYVEIMKQNIPDELAAELRAGRYRK